MKNLRLSFLIGLSALICISSSRPAPAVQGGLESKPFPRLAGPLANGAIGGYVEGVNQVAMAVEANGRIHVLWTGGLNPYFDAFLFYSSSMDGVNWSPYQILNYWQAYDPQIVVDDVHHRVHLMYRSNYDGILHRTVTNGIVSAPTVLDSSGVTSPRMAVEPVSGYVYAVWQKGSFHALEDGSNVWRMRTWYAYWNGTVWSARIKLINDADTCSSAIAAAPGGGVLLAWFQRCSQTQGGPQDPGEPAVSHSAYTASSPARFSLRQAVSSFYTLPEKDDSILLTYSGGDGKYYLVSDHLMWPGHSAVYRYTWQNGVWSPAMDVAKNTANWAVPKYVGAAADQPLAVYVYTNNWVLQMRTEINGVLGPVQAMADYLSERGYTGTPMAYFTDNAGNLHMTLAGDKDGISGFYYVAP